MRHTGQSQLRSVPRLHWAMVTIAAVQLWLGLLWFFYWGFGVTRGLIMLVVLAGLFLLRLLPPARPGEPVAASNMPKWLRWAIIAALLLDLGIMGVSGFSSWRTGHIPMDQGQTSWRAARLLDKGIDPYGLGEIVDFMQYSGRAGRRVSVGLDAGASPRQLQDYDRSLDPNLRAKYFPVPANPTAAQVREAGVTGYKYGPVILLITAAFAPLGIPAVVLWLNGLACFGLYAVLWRILRRIAGADITLAGAGILALLLDRHITRDYINRSATDVWALLFGSLGVLSYLARRSALSGLAFAASVACKIFPGLLFVPLLAMFRSAWPAAVFIAAVAFFYVPWFLWDATGILHNVFEFWVWLGTLSSSWQYHAPALLVRLVRIALLAGIAAVWARFLLGRDDRLFWCLAVSYTMLLLAGGAFDNNYVPWASIWIVAAIVEAFSLPHSNEHATAPRSESRAIELQM